MNKIKAFVHLIVTDDGRIGKIGSHLALFDNSQNSGGGYEFQHLYICTDEQIKEGDWILTDTGHIRLVAKNDTSNPDKYIVVSNNNAIFRKGCRKIAATTNLELLEKCPCCEGKEGHSETCPRIGKNIVDVSVAKISQSFILDYIKSYNSDSPITQVYLECVDIGYKIEVILNPIIRKNGEVILHPIEERMYSRKEMLEATHNCMILANSINNVGRLQKFIEEWFGKNYPI